MKRLFTLLAFFLVAAFTIAGCAASGPGDGRRAQSDSVSRTPGVLHLPGPDPMTLDPALTTDAGSATYIHEIFGGLLAIVADGHGGSAIAPDIAEAIPAPEFNTDGSVSYVFSLRKDVYFHQGRQVTAQDVKYSWERAAEPRTASSTVELYLVDIVGVLDKVRGNTREIPGVEVLDDFTLRVTIDSPKTYFLWKLTYPTTFVVDRVQVESNPRNWTRLPNGTGPFRLVKWDIGRTIVLEANPAFHLGPSKLVRAEFDLAAGNTLTMYENNEIDVSGVGIADIERVRDARDPLHREFIELENDISTSYVGFNVEKPPFDDVNVRRAFAMALDLPTVVHTVLKDAVVSAHSIVPPGMPGYAPPTDASFRYDPARARELLASSRYAGTVPRIVLMISGQGGTAGPVIDAIIEMWRQNLGVTVELEQAEFATFQENLKRGRAQMFSMGWIADYPDPEDFLDLKFHSSRSVANNETRYRNAAVDRLLEDARVEQDAIKRAALYRDAERILLGDVPWIPLYHGKHIMVVKPYVHGYHPQPVSMSMLRFVTVQ